MISLHRFLPGYDEPAWLLGDAEMDNYFEMAKHPVSPSKKGNLFFMTFLCP
jgi:hypothetical protein